jgi:hypothetical protein
MKLLEEIKDKNNQFDLGKLCSIMTKDEKEERELMKTMVARLRIN